MLIVDDDQTALIALERLLSFEGFDVRVANSGRAALDLASESPPDVIVTDLNMPEMDGVALLEQLRARQIDTPVIVATADSGVPSAVAAIRAGAADYLTKPIDVDALIFTIDRTLRTRDMQHVSAALHARNEALAADAERNLRAREELLSMVAHDLRGPLSTIALAVESRVPDDEPGSARRFEIVQRAAQRMRRLIDDLLDVARIETGGLALDLSSHQASAILREVLNSLEPIAEQVGVRLETVLEDDFACHCAFERIVQALVNLASNAINLTARGRRVRLVAERRGAFGWFAVEDEGPGIAPEHLPHVFERGWRLTAGRRGGAGLGLTIASGIVQAHGGTTGADSQVGAGSTFYFQLPLCGPDHSSWRMTPTATLAPVAPAPGVLALPPPAARASEHGDCKLPGHAARPRAPLL